MVVSQKWRVKIPLGYFLINRLNARERANLVTLAIQKLEDTGAYVVSMVCDSPSVQQSVLKKLGADLSSGELDPTIRFEGVDHPVYAFLDTPHAIKNIRNSWECDGTYYTSKGEAIKWEYVVQLYNVQSHRGIVLANKLNANHVYFHNQKQKVKFATQLFSQSTANGLKYMREVIKHPKFEGSKATEEFLVMVNDTFDVLNSRGKHVNKLKCSLSKYNKNLAFHCFNKAEKFLCELKTENGDLVINTRKRIGFVSLMFNILAVKKIFDTFVVPGSIPFLSTWYFNQDSLENFFCCVRSRFGANNNPTPSQFRNMYRRLLLGITGNIALSVNSNVMINSDCELTSITATTDEKMETIAPSMEDEEAEIKDLYMCQYDKDVATYIGGFVIRKLEKNVKCSSCTAGLKAPKPAVRSLTSIKDNGGLIYLHEDVQKVFIIAEKQLSCSLSLKAAISSLREIQQKF